MSALEQVILEKVRQLDVEQQQKVLDFVAALTPAPFDFEAWHAEADAIHAEILAKYGEDYTIDVQALLDEVRDEES